MSDQVLSGYTNEQNKYKYQSKERDIETNYDYFERRFYDSSIARFIQKDPHGIKYNDINFYASMYNNPISIIDPTGMDSVYIVDKTSRPKDDGTKGQTYSGAAIVVKNGKVVGAYRASNYPNSKSNKDNTTNSNTANTGEHKYNNTNGHLGGTKKGLNLVDANNQRNTPGTAAKGSSVTMTEVNVHSGESDNGNYNSRGSEGCATIQPDDASEFFSNFDWSNNGAGNTGTSEGSVFILRNDNLEIPFPHDAISVGDIIIPANNIPIQQVPIQ